MLSTGAAPVLAADLALWIGQLTDTYIDKDDFLRDLGMYCIASAIIDLTGGVQPRAWC